MFRDLSGAVGLLELHCPHRGTSLEFALVDAKGIRCCYHGWRFAADGTILETPGEPAESTLKNRLCHRAYPVHESLGIVFAYLGPPSECSIDLCCRDFRGSRGRTQRFAEDQ
jgi:phenylpropionate dioxygenase-like ring-hydroxylating dioxygenase large terminal subunit